MNDLAAAERDETENPDLERPVVPLHAIFPAFLGGNARTQAAIPAMSVSTNPATMIATRA